MKESPVFTRTHDLLLWLMRVTRKFPREYRFSMASRLEELGFTLQHALVAAAIDRRRETEHLIEADIALTNLRKSLLLCLELGLLDNGAYQHGGQLTGEVGRPLGTWRKDADARAARP
jgi:hypothetical protein